MRNLTKRQWNSIFALAVIVALVIWLAYLSMPPKNVRVVGCDVGQGDALLVQSGTNQILIDGGPSDRVIDCLTRHMPFWDRNIEIVILTHPQSDHLNGLIDVFEQYWVDTFVTTPVANSTSGFRLLEENVKKSGAEVVIAHEGMAINVGMIQLDILNPQRSEYDGFDEVLGAMTSDDNLNNFSVVVALRYGEFDALFPGDIEPQEIQSLIARDLFTDIEYLKVPHHGSRNGLTKELLDITNPEVSVISVGTKNRFGHPHKEVIQMLEADDTKYFRTDIEGDVLIETDGNNFWQVNNFRLW